jgi:hypothetical protein
MGDEEEEVVVVVVVVVAVAAVQVVVVMVQRLLLMGSILQPTIRCVPITYSCFFASVSLVTPRTCSSVT